MEELGRRFTAAAPEVARLLEAPFPDPRSLVRRQRPATAEFPLDWGAEVPLVPPCAAGGRRLAARDRPLEERLQLGQVLQGTVCYKERVALIASADHGHAHEPGGPYGFDPAAAEYDARLQEILDSGRLDFLPLADLADRAKADSLWQLVVLQGAVGEAARADVLAYGAPTYYGMLVAEIQTAA
jgi:aromatic ring-opening dioxygenase LigB subunit